LARILLLPSDRQILAFLVHALPPAFQPEVVGDFASLESRLNDSEAQACILDLFAPPPPIPLQALQKLREEFPRVALVIASEFRGREVELYRLGRMAVDGVIRLETRPSSREIQTILDQALASALATRARLALQDTHPPLAVQVIGWAIEHADSRPQVSDLGAAMATRPRGLARQLRAVGSAPPRSLLLWGRLVRACHLLERPPETVESVAFRLGYSTGGALGKLLKRYVGCSPTDLLARGGVSWVLNLLKEKSLRSEREGGQK
jgi:AraC-like DNA-binding protein